MLVYLVFAGLKRLAKYSVKVTFLIHPSVLSMTSNCRRSFASSFGIRLWNHEFARSSSLAWSSRFRASGPTGHLVYTFVPFEINENT
ncbi:hypothetical protein L596_021740 [Steinernema carpocapsae]|uniref:Uncharacterized protein n=1 Tax=Steinernema carpocapsae TaxID=34508 RepID=A0A4U5MJL8_STECR|nr:hypothetical protein L596_021740 [Steinernema carpocapsae]